MLILLAGIAAAACPAPSTTADLQRKVETALLTFVQLDDEGFELQRRGAIDSVTCLGEVVHAPHAASFLRMEGVAAFASGNQAFAVSAFRSALSVQPNYQLKAALAPPGGPLSNVYESARQAPPTTWTLPPSGGVRFVNGIQTDTVPMGLAIVQLAGADGRVQWTGILTRPEDLPPTFASMVPYVAPAPLPQPVPAPIAPAPTPVPVAPVPQPVVDLDDLDDRAARGGKNGAKTATLVVAGVLGAAAAGLYTGSILTRTRYEAAPTAKRRVLTNNLWYAGVGTAGVALTVGVVGVALPSKKKAKPSRPAPAEEELY